MLYDGDDLIDQSGEYATYLFSDRAEKIIKSQPDSEPMFMYLSYTGKVASVNFFREQALNSKLPTMTSKSRDTNQN